MKDSGEEWEAVKRKHNELLKKVKVLINDRDVIEKILEEIPKAQDTTKELYETNRKKRILKLLNLAGLYTDEEINLYKEALQFSTPGYAIILERDLD